MTFKLHWTRICNCFRLNKPSKDQQNHTFDTERFYYSLLKDFVKLAHRNRSFRCDDMHKIVILIGYDTKTPKKQFVCCKMSKIDQVENISDVIWPKLLQIFIYICQRSIREFKNRTSFKCYITYLISYDTTLHTWVQIDSQHVLAYIRGAP